MLENRSFDNILGWLYDQDNDRPFQAPPHGQTFDGVSRKGLTNPKPGGGEAIVDECTDIDINHEETIFNLLEKPIWPGASTTARPCSSVSPICSIRGFMLSPASIKRRTVSFRWNSSMKMRRTANFRAIRGSNPGILTAP